MRYFFDQHFHVMTMKHPNFLSFFSAMETGLPEILGSGAFSPSYILTGKNWNVGNMRRNLSNTVTTFEQPIGRTLAMMEDDLRGAFEQVDEDAVYPKRPYIGDDNLLHFRNTTYDKMAMCPLLMDFSQKRNDHADLYYPSNRMEKIIAYAEDTLEGLRWYRTNRPDGLFEFFPFIGINPAMHSATFIQHLLETYVRTDHRKWKEGDDERKRFYGIKFYPPLGYDPWPKEAEEREKVCMIYEFCSEHRIPIMTHCDDQGFRGVPVKQAWAYTDPQRYRPVLERYPDLFIDFAHYGWQYHQMAKEPRQVITSLVNRVPDSPWFHSIIELMNRYPNVHADVSFSGANSDFYVQLRNFITGKDKQEAERILRRTLFGTDFSVNLLKVESYTNYYRLFELSPFDDDEIQAFVTDNPQRFMGLELRT